MEGGGAAPVARRRRSSLTDVQLSYDDATKPAPSSCRRDGFRLHAPRESSPSGSCPIWPTLGPHFRRWATETVACSRRYRRVDRIYLAVAFLSAIPLHSHTELRLHTRTRSPTTLQADCRVNYRAATSELPSCCSRGAEHRPPTRAQAHVNHTALVLFGGQETTRYSASMTSPWGVPCSGRGG